MARYASAAARLWHRIRFELGHRGMAHATLALERDAMLPLRGSKHFTMTCLEGVLWITEDSDRRDIILEPGGRHELARGGTAVVIALTPARVRIQPPVQDWRPVFGWVLRPTRGV